MCGGIGIRPYCMYGPQYGVRVFVHVGHAKVIVSARAPLSYDVWLRHKAWAGDYYIRYMRLGLTLSVCICDGP